MRPATLRHVNIGGRLLAKYGSSGDSPRGGPPREPGRGRAIAFALAIGLGGTALLALLTMLAWQHEATAKAVVGVIMVGLFLALAWRAAVNVQHHGIEGLWHTIRYPLGDGTYTPLGLAWGILAVLAVAACIMLAARWGWLPARSVYRSNSFNPARRRFWWRLF